MIGMLLLLFLFLSIVLLLSTVHGVRLLLRVRKYMLLALLKSFKLGDVTLIGFNEHVKSNKPSKL